MTYTILPDFVLHSYINQNFKYFGIDSPKFCVDQEHFENYPHSIDYQYNSRGFRDSEWPDNLHELQNAIWCVGDSFTIGLGSPLEHTWPYMLQQATGTRTINVSMNGASNMWMSRRIVDSILKEIQPKIIVVQWSFIHRRELTVEEARRDHQQVITDEMRLLHFDTEKRRFMSALTASDQDNINNVVQCIQHVEANKGNTQIIHSFIPAACSAASKHIFLSQLDQLNIQSIGPVEHLDFARDKFHYDVKTSKNIVNNLLTLI